MARRRGRGPVGREAGSAYEKLLALLSRRALYLEAVLLAAILVVAFYIRAVPALRYGLELDANDPWIAYWLAKYFVENGLFNFEGLRSATEFWYPIGRDFLKTEFIGLSWLAAATYPIGKAFGLTLREWISLFPVFAGTAATLMAHLLVRSLTRSPLAALTAALFMAVTPATIVRTTAGFVEKIGFSMPFILAFLLLLHRALEAGPSRRGLALAVAGGILGGFVGWLWGGVHFVVALFALIIVLDALLRGPSREDLKVYLAAAVGVVVVSSAYPALGPSYYLSSVGAVLPAAIAYYALLLFIKERLGVFNPRLGLWILALAVSAGLILAYNGVIPVGGRILAALGVSVPSPLVTSVQEHQPAQLRTILTQAGIPAFLAFAGLVFEVIAIARRRLTPDASTVFRLTFYIITIFLVYATSRMAYFLQLVGFASTVAAGAAVGVFTGAAITAGLQQPTTRMQRKATLRARSPQQLDPLKMVGLVLVMMLVVASGVAYAASSYSQAELRAPAIDTGMLPPLVFTTQQGSRLVIPFNDAWKIALDWIANNTRPDAVVVSWWDYGYWITVNTGRATVADGATYNETQIRILARILTGTEDEASALLKLLGLEPNNTYIVFYDAFHVIVDERGVATILPMFSSARSPVDPTLFLVTHGRGDLIKSYQMLRISWRIDPFNSTPFTIPYSSRYVDPEGNSYLHFPGFIGSPAENVERVREALLYKMTIYGMQELVRKGVLGPRCSGVLDNVTATLPSVFASDAVGALLLAPVDMNRFTLEAVAVDCIEGTITQGTVATQASLVAVFIYKWTG